MAGRGPAVLPALLAVPSVWWVLGLGQNSFLNASLMAAGTLLLERQPVAAGLAFGALCYKPHLGLLVPVALVAGRRWRAFGAAGATVAVICLATWVLYGPTTWQAFLAMAEHSDQAIGGGDVLFAAHADPTGALRYAGLPWPAARSIGVLMALATAAWVAWAWVRPVSAPVRYALLVAGTLLVVPFALFYDLVLASLAAAWLARSARSGGFLPGEKAGFGICIGLNLLAAVPVITRAPSGVAFGALVPPLLFLLALRRAWARGGTPKKQAVTRGLLTHRKIDTQHHGKVDCNHNKRTLVNRVRRMVSRLVVRHARGLGLDVGAWTWGRGGACGLTTDRGFGGIDARIEGSSRGVLGGPPRYYCCGVRVDRECNGVCAG
ncbi:MAG: glycosyltransferase family 87 protein [Rhodospirillales bacterium]